jgi:hypothetical protein
MPFSDLEEGILKAHLQGLGKTAVKIDATLPSF